jgi:hypothetical protein
VKEVSKFDLERWPDVHLQAEHTFHRAGFFGFVDHDDGNPSVQDLVFPFAMM